MDVENIQIMDDETGIRNIKYKTLKQYNENKLFFDFGMSDIWRKNAEKLKLATIETAKEAERGIVEIETLQATNASLISTLDEVMKIQEEGRAKRQAAEVEMKRIENELKTKLLQMRG